MTTDTAEPLQQQPQRRPRKVVHLIHGTWPYGLLAHRLRFLRRGPIWAEAGSPIRTDIATQVADDDVSFRSFTWSGDNAFAARSEAAQALVQHLQTALQEEPQATHLLVGHSHGGTVAVEAMQRAPGLAHAGVAGILSLATPFVSLHAPAGEGWEHRLQALIARFAPYLVLLIALFAWASLDRAPGMTYSATFLRLLVMGVVLLVVLHASHVLPWFPMPGRRFAGTLLEHPLPALDPGIPLFAIRAPRDEASLAIAAGQVFGVLSDLMWWALVYSPIAWFRRAPLTFIALLCGVSAVHIAMGMYQTADLQGFERAFSVALYASLMMWAAFAVPVLVAFLILLPASVALALAAGIEVLAMPGRLTVDAEPLPAGGTTRELLILDLPADERERLLMRHSIYELSSARQAVAQWIRRMPGGG